MKILIRQFIRSNLIYEFEWVFQLICWEVISFRYEVVARILIFGSNLTDKNVACKLEFWEGSWKLRAFECKEYMKSIWVWRTFGGWKAFAYEEIWLHFE